MDYDNPWTYKNKNFTSDDIKNSLCFVYIITNTINNKKYIGKKTFVNILRVKQGTRKLKKTVKKESDWKKYYGSSKSLLLDVKEYGKENFSRQILHLCHKKSLATYHEAREQFSRKVLEKEDYYNEWIFCRIVKSNIIEKKKGGNSDE